MNFIFRTIPTRSRRCQLDLMLIWYWHTCVIPLLIILLLLLLLLIIIIIIIIIIILKWSWHTCVIPLLIRKGGHRGVSGYEGLCLCQPISLPNYQAWLRVWCLMCDVSEPGRHVIRHRDNATRNAHWSVIWVIIHQGMHTGTGLSCGWKCNKKYTLVYHMGDNVARKAH